MFSGPGWSILSGILRHAGETDGEWPVHVEHVFVLNVRLGCEAEAMNLREALDRCTDAHFDDWIRMPGGQSCRPATSIVAGSFDPGMLSGAETRPLAGHSMAVYEPDPSLSLVWPVPEDDRDLELPRERFVPEWAETDSQTWKSAKSGFVVVLLSGAPIWQARLWNIDWGSGIDGFVPDFTQKFDELEIDPESSPPPARWTIDKWSIGLASLINGFSHLGGEFAALDPTTRIVEVPEEIHPIDRVREF